MKGKKTEGAGDEEEHHGKQGWGGDVGMTSRRRAGPNRNSRMKTIHLQACLRGRGGGGSVPILKECLLPSSRVSLIWVGVRRIWASYEAGEQIRPAPRPRCPAAPRPRCPTAPLPHGPAAPRPPGSPLAWLPSRGQSLTTSSVPPL